jgi:hypothetical protein
LQGASAAPPPAAGSTEFAKATAAELLAANADLLSAAHSSLMGAGTMVRRQHDSGLR